MATTYDMMQTPDKKISLADAMELFRYRYEDTGYNANLHPKNRAIGINRTESVHIFWLRDNKPQVMHYMYCLRGGYRDPRCSIDLYRRLIRDGFSQELLEEARALADGIKGNESGR